MCSRDSGPGEPHAVLAQGSGPVIPTALRVWSRMSSVRSMAIGRSAPPPVSNGLSSTRMMNSVVVMTTATAPIWTAWTYQRSAARRRTS